MRLEVFFWGGGCRAALRHLGPAHLESPGPGPESPLTGGDFADPRQAEERWSRLNRGLASSRPWLLQEGRRCPRPGRHKPPGFARAVAGPPLLSHGDTTLPLAPVLPPYANKHGHEQACKHPLNEPRAEKKNISVPRTVSKGNQGNPRGNQGKPSNTRTSM